MKNLNWAFLLSIGVVFLISPLCSDLHIKSLNYVYDGDTIKVDLDYDMPEIFSKNLSINSVNSYTQVFTKNFLKWLKMNLNLSSGSSHL